MNPIRIGARTSPLARAQADQVAGWLQARGWRTEFVGITTTGDVDQRALTQIGGTGVFVGAVREALYDRRIDVAVHSLKDLPTAPAPALEVAANPAREDTRDVLVGRTLETLRDGDRIGTGSPGGPCSWPSWRSGWASTWRWSRSAATSTPGSITRRRAGSRPSS